MPRILSTNNPVVKVSGLRPSTLTTGLLVLILNTKVVRLKFVKYGYGEKKALHF